MSVRPPAVAGQFYPANPVELRRAVEGYIKGADVTPAPSRVVAIVAPHAGYVFSGPTAGYAYARLQGKNPSRVILLGVSHRYNIPHASIYEKGAFDTPLGPFPVDTAFAERIADVGGELFPAYVDEARVAEPHIAEHCLEVQLPFLRVAIGEVPIVPVLFGSPAQEWHVAFGQRLAEWLDPDDLVVASTDLSHYLTEEKAHQVDIRTIDAILARDTFALSAGLQRGAYSMCGGAAVVAAMAFATKRGAASWSLLDYRTSGESSGDLARVVGYAAISMEMMREQGSAT